MSPILLITLHHSKFHNNFRVSGPIFRVICPGKPQIFEKLEFLEILKRNTNNK